MSTQHSTLVLRAIAVATLLASVALLPHVAQGYGFLYVPASDGVPRRWNQATLPDGRVPWFVSSQVGGNVSGDRPPFDVLQRAFASWEELTTSSIRFAFQGTRGARDRSSGDRVNLVTLGANENLGTGVLAATFLSSDAAGNLVDVDIVFGKSVAFGTSENGDAGSYDLEGVATHEIGHLLGLEHSGLSRATMVPFSDREDLHQRTPHDDDRIGASLLYPEDGFLAGSGSLSGRVTVAGAPVYVAHVVAADVNGPILAGAYTAPDGSYRIDGLPPDVYVVYAEPLDGPVAPGNVSGFRSAFGAVPTVGYGTFFH